MNLGLRISRQENTNVLWEPFATSTPLKTVPSKEKIIHELRLLTQTDSVNFVGKNLKGNSDVFQGKISEIKHFVSKKARKNRSSANVDLSSSSDDDSIENKRPIIKISSSQKARSFLKCKKLGSEESIDETNHIADNCSKVECEKDSKKITITTSLGLKPQNGELLDGKNKYKKGSTKLNLKANNSCVNSYNGSKVFNETESNKLVKGLKTCSPINNKEDKMNLSNNETNIREKLDTIPKTASDFLKTKNSVNNTQNKTLKRKRRNNVSDTSPIKKFLTNSSKPKLSQKMKISSSSPLHAWENKRNLSHQLFSDSREQEFINTLDLTSDEVNLMAESMKYNLWQKQIEIPHKQVISSQPSKKNEDDILEREDDKKERPKRKKNKPKEFWISGNKSDKHLINVDVEEERQSKKNSSKKDQNPKPKLLPKLNEEPELAEIIKENNPDNIINAGSLKNPKGLKTGKRKKTKINEIKKSDESNEAVVTSTSDTKIKIKGQPVFDKEIKENNLETMKKCSSPKRPKVQKRGRRKKNTNEPNDAVVTSTNDNKMKTEKTNFVFTCSKKVEKDKESNKMLTTVDIDRETNATDRTVFKQLDELSFEDNRMGCLAAPCWSLNNIKCGVFKLLVNAQLKCKTAHSNSYLGGVIIKGSLKMRIGDNVLHLKEGDMAFVPPLTEWQATNIGDCESTFYYWVGRFNS